MNLRIFIAFVISLSLLGCQDNTQQNLASESEEVANMVDERLFDIQHLFEAPMATEKHDLSSVIKVVFSEGTDVAEDTIAIDVQASKIYYEARVTSTGIEAKTGSGPLTDAHLVIDILQTHHVQQWGEGPALTAEDFGWALWLQFEDGTVEKYGDIGTTADRPDYDAFASELREYVKTRVIQLDPNKIY